MHRDADAPLLQLLDEGVAIEGELFRAQTDDEQVPCVLLRPGGQPQEVQAAEGGEVAACHGAPALQERGRLAQLHPADGCGEIRQVVLVTGGDDIVFPRGPRRRVAVPHVPVDTVKPHDAKPAASSSLSVTAIPPSPVVIVLVA